MKAYITLCILVALLLHSHNSQGDTIGGPLIVKPKLTAEIIIPPIDPVPAASSTTAPPSGGTADSSSTDRLAPPPTPKAFIIAGPSGVPTTPVDPANTAFQALLALGGGCCDKCKSLQYFAFRIQGTNTYLSAQPTSFTWLRFWNIVNPGPSQLFEGIQNADCTWSFKNMNGEYLKLSVPSPFWVTDSSSITLETRFKFIRNSWQSWTYIQSAYYPTYYWLKLSFFGIQYLGYQQFQASRFVVEFWPS